MSERASVNVALIHWPVFDKARNIVCTNVTNFDIHDIARASRTYGIDKYFIVNRLKEQLSFVSRIVEHWTMGTGAEYNPSRAASLKIIEPRENLEECLKDFSEKPLIVATSARELGIPRIGYKELRERIWSPPDNRPVLLVFGTGYGLDNSILEQADMLLAPIKGASKDDFRHLSVRSAVSIILDRLLGT